MHKPHARIENKQIVKVCMAVSLQSGKCSQKHTIKRVHPSNHKAVNVKQVYVPCGIASSTATRSLLRFAGRYEASKLVRAKKKKEIKSEKNYFNKYLNFLYKQKLQRKNFWSFMPIRECPFLCFRGWFF